MNWISNIWQHPRTTATGLLIAVGTVAGVLSQSGVSIGHIGNGNAVTLAGALATALLGLLARDPASKNSNAIVDGIGTKTSTSAAQSTSGAILKSLVVVSLLMPLPFMDGCTANSVAQDIVNWTPAMQSAVVTVDATAAMLDPSDAPVFQAATGGFDAASNLLATQAKTYLANPGAGTLAALQTQVVAFEQQVNTALLSAARIGNLQSQQKALVSIQAVATAVSAILALVQSISSSKMQQQMAAQSTIKLSQVEPLLNRETQVKMVAAHYGEPPDAARAQVDRARSLAIQAGF